MNETEREVATGVLNLAAFWLFLQYVLPVIVVLAIAYFIYRAVRQPRHAEFSSSEPEDRLGAPDHREDWPRR
jgi:hypothetical protein